MEGQHPIPQQISSYQFRLVGDMTLKQFFQVASGALVALFLYATNLPSFIKWPLVGLSLLAGAAIAFMPLEERTLDKWFVIFIKAIYSPTLYSWKKLAEPEKFFQKDEIAPDPVTAPHGKKALTDYISQAFKFPTTSSEAKLDKQEDQRLRAISQFLSGTEEGKQIAPAPFVQPAVQPPTVMQAQIAPAPTTTLSHQMPVQGSPVPGSLKIPKTGLVSVDKKEVVYESSPRSQQAADSPPPRPMAPFPISSPQTAKRTLITTEPEKPVFTQKAAPPEPSTQPNILVGQVVDENNKIIEGAILEIRDMDARPARALKSNKLGHFFIVTKLLEGKYQITTEKEGFTFKPILFEAKGEIIPPILVKGTANKN